jgi:hypothetical protein
MQQASICEQFRSIFSEPQTVRHRAAGHPAQRGAFKTLYSTADNLVALHEGRCVQHEEQRHEECRN